MSKETLVEKFESEGISKPVVEAFKKIPREEFVLDRYKGEAYQDVPLPILAGQTISQPTTVMLMLDALKVRPGMKVLEIGAGSGYNAALLGLLAGPKGKVFTTEIIGELAEFAKANLEKIRARNVQVLAIDGSKGYAKEAPYDRIICTAAAPKIPDVLIEQLKDGGVLLIPVGPEYGQEMIRVRKVKGRVTHEKLGGFIFVPLRGKYGR